MEESDYTFAYFPYLKTSESLSYRDLTIKSCENLSGLPSDAVPHLKIINNMFFLRDHIRIQKMSYAFHDPSKGLHVSDFTRQLLEFQTIVCFIYSKPHHIFGDPLLYCDHASLYLVKPKRISKYQLIEDYNTEILPEFRRLSFDSRDEIEGYEIRLNNKSYFYVTYGNRIFPPTLGLWLNIDQDLSFQFKNSFTASRVYKPVIEYFATRKKSDNDILSERILTALNWHNRSIGKNIEEDSALINLAIAFECLLGLESKKEVTDRFREAVSLLVGEVPRLDSWLSQFYDARSKIVHEGRISNLMYMATENTKKSLYHPELEYRSLLAYGRWVFHICVATILNGALNAEALNLAALLVTNKQRFERICKLLDMRDGTSAKRILDSNQYVREIEIYLFVGEKDLKPDLLIGAAKRMIREYLKSTPEESPELIKQMQNFTDLNSKDNLNALSLLKEILDGIQSGSMAKSRSVTDLCSIVSSMINSVWHYTFRQYYELISLQRENKTE